MRWRSRRQDDVATDPRSLATQARTRRPKLRIKAALLASPASSTSGLDVYCRQGVGAGGRGATGLTSGSGGGEHRARTGRETCRDQLRSLSALLANDLEIKEQIRAWLIADTALVSGRVHIAVFAGHVVLVGVVTSQASVQKFISDARSVPGVLRAVSRPTSRRCRRSMPILRFPTSTFGISDFELRLNLVRRRKARRGKKFSFACLASLPQPSGYALAGSPFPSIGPKSIYNLTAFR